MKKLFTLLILVLLAESLSAQVTVIREFYNTDASNESVTAYEAPHTPAPQDRTERTYEVDEEYRKGASYTVTEDAVYFGQIMSFEVEVLRRMYIIDNVYGGVGGGLRFSTGHVTSDISSWGLAAELPLVVGTNLFNGWLGLQAGPCLAYTFAGGGKSNVETQKLSSDAKRAAVTFDINIMALGSLGVKLKLGNNIQMIGLAFSTSF